MKKIICITSMNQEYFDHVGRACIETYSKFWPQDIKMYVYNEYMPFFKKRKNVAEIQWSNLGQQFTDFCNRTENTRIVQFAKKAFPIIHAMENLDFDRLIWLDADVATKIPLNQQLLDMLSPDDVLSTHFGVNHEWPTDDDSERISFSCETGFFILNKQHPMFEEFKNRYTEYYLKDLGYSLRRFYDGEVYGAVVNELESQGAKMLELNPGYVHKTPIPRSILAPYLQHYKAGAKDTMNNEEILALINAKTSINEAMSAINRDDNEV